MRPALQVLVVGVLAILGGCVGTHAPAATATPDRTASPTATPTTRTATPQSPTFDCPYRLHVEAAGEAPATETVSYESLPPDRRHEFDRARRNGTITLSGALPDAWGQATYVEYDGETYYVVASTC